MKTPTIDNYLESIQNPSGRFKTLKTCTVLCDDAGIPLYAVHSTSVDFVVTYPGNPRPTAICCSIGRKNSFELRETLRGRYACAGSGEPVLLLNEMLVFDDGGESRWCDVWLAELPDTSFFPSQASGIDPSAPKSSCSLTSFSEGLAVTEQEGKYGFVDRDGRTVIPFRYDWADAFDEGLALVRQNDLFGLIDKTGREVLAPVYEDIRWRSSNGVIPACGENGAWRLYDREGNVISPNAFDFIFDFSCGLASVRRENKYGYIDSRGEVVIPLIYDEAYTFSEEGLATAVKNGSTFMIDTEGMVFD